MLRIQKGEGFGVGVYRDHFGYKIMKKFHGEIYDQFITDSPKDHPGPHRDSKMRDEWNALEGRTAYLFGFRDERQLRAWVYDDKVLEELASHGFEIVRYRIPKNGRCIVGHTQMVAHRDDMVRVGIHKLK
jgi:hypothetical protein